MKVPPYETDLPGWARKKASDLLVETVLAEPDPGVPLTAVRVTEPLKGSPMKGGPIYCGTYWGAPRHEILVRISLRERDYPVDNLMVVPAGKWKALSRFGILSREPGPGVGARGIQVSGERWRPLERRPYGGMRSPVVVFNSWQEALVGVLAHELRHHQQEAGGRPRSEAECEWAALRSIARMRGFES